MPLKMPPQLLEVWTDIDSQVRSILNVHLRREFQCASPDTMRFWTGSIGGWRASGRSSVRPYAFRHLVVLSLTLVWDTTAGGGNGAPILTVDTGVGHTGEQVTRLLEHLQRLRADIVVRLLDHA
jgi:hypothetical protein